MTAEEMASVWVPVPMRWRNIQPGDVIVGKDGTALYMVRTCDLCPDGIMAVSVEHASTETYHGLDPDEVATVLLPAALRDAMELSRDELGARLLERRTA